MAESIKTYLIIDDDLDDQELLEIVIHEIDPNISCYAAHNGLEGLAFLNSNPSPDMVFLDLNMPKMNGKECLKALKSDIALCEIPVVILSTSDNPFDKAEVLTLGAVAFYTKPSSTSELKQILLKLLKSQQKSIIQC